MARSAQHRHRHRHRQGTRASVIALVLVLVGAGLLTSARLVGSTFAAFNAETVNANSTFTDGSLTVPTALQATASGLNADLSWTAGSNGDQYYVLGYDNTTSSSCPAAGSSQYASVAAASSSSYSYAPSGNGGDWWCYEVENAFGTSWTSVNDGSGTTNINPTAAVQIGFVPTALSLANGTSATSSGCAGGTPGTAGTLDCGDQIVVTLNQKPSVPTTAGLGLCMTGATTLLVGVASCTSTTAPVIGTLTLSGGTASTTNVWYPATFTWPTSAPWTVTVTVGTQNGSPTTVSASSTLSWTLSTPGSMTSSVGNVALCTTTNLCQPSTSTSF